VLVFVEECGRDVFSFVIVLVGNHGCVLAYAVWAVGFALMVYVLDVVPCIKIDVICRIGVMLKMCCDYDDVESRAKQYGVIGGVLFIFFTHILM